MLSLLEYTTHAIKQRYCIYIHVQYYLIAVQVLDCHNAGKLPCVITTPLAPKVVLIKALYYSNASLSSL